MVGQADAAQHIPHHPGLFLPTHARHREIGENRWLSRNRWQQLPTNFALRLLPQARGERLSKQREEREATRHFYKPKRCEQMFAQRVDELMPAMDQGVAGQATLSDLLSRCFGHFPDERGGRDQSRGKRNTAGRSKGLMEHRHPKEAGYTIGLVRTKRLKLASQALRTNVNTEQGLSGRFLRHRG